MKDKYKLIQPAICNDIYESSNPVKCAKLFYEKIKNSSFKNDAIIMKNITTNKQYKFKIMDSIQIGGKTPIEKEHNSSQNAMLIEVKNELKEIRNILLNMKNVPQTKTTN